MQETLRQNNYKVVRRHESNVWWCFTIISQGNYLCLLLKESRCLNRLSKIGMHFHQIFGGLFVWKISLTQPSVSQSQISIIAYMSGDCVMSTVYSPTSGFYLRRSYWGSWKRLNIWRCPRRRWPCSDRICGPRESPWRGTRSGPATTSVRQPNIA